MISDWGLRVRQSPSCRPPCVAVSEFVVGVTAKKNGRIDFPVKLLAVSFGVNREKLVLKDFVPAAATLRLGGIYAK